MLQILSSTAVLFQLLMQVSLGWVTFFFINIEKIIFSSQSRKADYDLALKKIPDLCLDLIGHCNICTNTISSGLIWPLQCEKGCQIHDDLHFRLYLAIERYEYVSIYAAAITAYFHRW